MSIILIYESGASNETTDITEHLQLYTWESTEMAEEGAVGISQFTLEDPDGTLDIKAWRRVWAYEDTAVGSNTLIFYGWVTDKTVTRANYQTGAGRIWQVQAADQNVVLGFRVFSFNQANRPVETDVARVDWLMGVVDGFGRAPITVDEFTFGAGAVLMDAVDYRGQTVLDILADCAQQSGKNYYCYTKDFGYPTTAPQRGIWYGSTEHTVLVSPLRLSNVLTDIDDTWTLAISDDTELERRGDRVYSGAYIQYDGGAVYEQDIDTYNEFTQRDLVVSFNNVKTQGGATRRAQRVLADLDEEDDRISTSFWVPREKINFVKPGMRIQIRASHLPGYETTFAWARILQITKKEVAEGDGNDIGYMVSVILGSNPLSGVCGELGLTQTSGVTYLTAVNTLPAGLTTCLQVWVEVVRTATPELSGPGTPPSGFTIADWAYVQAGDSNDGRIKVAYRVTQPGDPVTVTSADSGGDRAHILYEFGGINQLLDTVTASDQPNASSITSAAVNTGTDMAVVLGVFVKDGHGPAGGNTNPDLAISAPATQTHETGTLVTNDQGPTIVVGYRLYDPASGTATMTATGDSTGFATGSWGYVVAAFVP